MVAPRDGNGELRKPEQRTRARRTRSNSAPPSYFALLFLAMLVVTQLAVTYLGNAGVYTLAGIMGVSDVDPFIMGMTQAAGQGDAARRCLGGHRHCGRQQQYRQGHLRLCAGAARNGNQQPVPAAGAGGLRPDCPCYLVAPAPDVSRRARCRAAKKCPANSCKRRADDVLAREGTKHIAKEETELLSASHGKKSVRYHTLLRNFAQAVTSGKTPGIRAIFHGTRRDTARRNRPRSWQRGS
jgi:hypothetical protein